MINEELKTRLFKYKFVKRRMNKIVDWEQENQDELMDMWIAYCRDIGPIKYDVFFENVFYGILPQVDKKSYKHLIQI